MTVTKPDVIKTVKSLRLKWAGHLARMGKNRTALKVQKYRQGGKRSIGRPKCTWEGNDRLELRSLKNGGN